MKQENVDKLASIISDEYGVKGKFARMVAEATLEAAGRTMILLAYALLEDKLDEED